MKKLLSLVAALFAFNAMGADKEDTKTSTEDTSKNPITGTVTTTKKSKKKVADENGKKEVNVKTKKKQKTDGSVEESVKVEGESEKK